MTSLRDAFARAHAEGRAALIAYLPAGYPNVAESAELVAAVAAAGADIIEVGMPYSDPVMDGPVIQRASEQSLAQGTTLADAIVVASAAEQAGAAACVMSYWNPIEQYGAARFADDLARAGGCAVVTPDLNPDEAADWVTATDAANIQRIFLVAPSSSRHRLVTVSEHSNGFVYAASMMGVTGSTNEVSAAARALVLRTREVTDNPIAVGLGISTAAQVQQVAEYADAVIVGSAFVRAIESGDTPAARLTAVTALARELAAGTIR